ncbi:MAG: DEAD/DEAH box helicase [Nitriliruptoraceae bacterium]|nr:DEAD/DEAH box helicase [Nitriliruptoraceae bacterium]
MDPRDVLDLLVAEDEVAADGDADDLRLVFRTSLPARQERTVPLPDELPGILTSRLERLGIEHLWSHQAEVRDRVLAGRHTVVATGTASGKSLAYQLPTIELLLDDPDAVALYLAPTKALAHDQLRALRAFTLPQLRPAVVDGDTPRPERDAIRRTANWILTNPDLLHHGLLPNHRAWADVLHHLRVVVIDEAHVARGVFGSHVALVLRRLRRLAERYDADPTFVFASATIGNPAAHASALIGAEVGAVEQDGAPRGPVELGAWLPPWEDDGERRRSMLRETADLLGRFVAADVPTLVFTRSRKGAELVALGAQERLGDARDDAGRPLAAQVAAYRAGYLAEERRALEQALQRGELKGVAATEALELGIDVQGLDAVLLAGWPGTTAAFWQRIGRAGRRRDAAVGLLVAQEDPLDHYLVTHPEELLGRPSEDAIVDAENPYLLAGHLRCACQEAPLADEEALRWFGAGAPALLAEDVEAGRLRLRGGRHYWTSRGRAAAEVGLRSIGGRAIRIISSETGQIIGDVDEAKAHRTVHPGAVYLHQGQAFVVEALDLEQHLALVGPHHQPGLTTRPRTDTDVRVLDIERRLPWGEVELAYGAVEVTNQVTGYEVVRIASGEVLDRVELALPPQQLRTRAVWYAIPEGLLDDAGLAPAVVPGSLHAAEHAAIGMLPLLALCDRWDLGGLSTARHADTDRPTVFIYDGFPGGAGLAERSFDRFDRHVRLTRATIASCHCSAGCPSCVQSPKCGNGNDPLDKAGAVQVLDLLLAQGDRERAALQR